MNDVRRQAYVEAVQKYIEGNSKSANADDDQPAQAGDGPKDLFGNPIPVKPKQRKMF